MSTVPQGVNLAETQQPSLYDDDLLSLKTIFVLGKPEVVLHEFDTSKRFWWAGPWV
jgi:hypothetical protein